MTPSAVPDISLYSAPVMVMSSGSVVDTAMPRRMRMTSVAATGSGTKKSTHPSPAPAAFSPISSPVILTLPDTKPRITRPAAIPARSRISPIFEATRS